MAKKRVSHKIQLYVDPAGGTDFQLVSNIKSISYPGFSTDEIDVTYLDDDIVRYLPSPTGELGDLGLGVFWDEADVTDHQRLTTIAESQADPDPENQPHWAIVFNFATPIARTMHGFIMELGDVSYEVKTEVTRDVVITTTTRPVAGVVDDIIT